MNFKLDVNYLDGLIKTSQSAEKIEDPVKKTIQLGLQSSCSIYVRSGKKIGQAVVFILVIIL